MNLIKKHISTLQLTKILRCLGVWSYAGTNYGFIDKRLL
jgi:hypothetical protein